MKSSDFFRKLPFSTVLTHIHKNSLLTTLPIRNKLHFLKKKLSSSSDRCAYIQHERNSVCKLKHRLRSPADLGEGGRGAGADTPLYYFEISIFGDGP